nr:MAG TPA_asm: hypothetical protein [Caudoviricetes sp.]
MVHHRRQPVSGLEHCRKESGAGRRPKRPVYGAGAHCKRNAGGGQEKWTDR